MTGIVDRDSANAARFQAGGRQGHYESWFQRANHPTRPLAFWIRYTIFSPRNHPERARGELWAIYFDGEQKRIIAVKEEVPLERCQFSHNSLAVQLDAANLSQDSLSGAVHTEGRSIAWNLAYTSPEPHLLLLPRDRYNSGFPKAKALVGSPNAAYTGSLQINGEAIAVDHWIGSQNHNWGARHTDHYAWGQVAGFDNVPDAFLELSTARVRLGPIYTPFLTLAVLRVHGRELRLNNVVGAAFATGRFDYFDWNFARSSGDDRIEGRIHAPREAFVALRYDDPPGGSKTCLNTKLASCELKVFLDGGEHILQTRNRAAFEILTDDVSHGLTAVV